MATIHHQGTGEIRQLGPEWSFLPTVSEELSKTNFDQLFRLLDILSHPDKAKETLTQLAAAAARAEDLLSKAEAAQTARKNEETLLARRRREHDAQLKSERAQHDADIAASQKEIDERLRIAAIVESRAKEQAERAEAHRLEAEQRLNRMKAAAA